jgi:two-component system, OmpR family, alkaline phosphatase synthesis response regulator PhoP
VTTTRSADPSTRSSVLLIEDDAETREAMAALLSGAGLSVIASDEGRKALELAGVTRPSLVLLDLVTSGMNGWEFLERSVEEPALTGVPVVVVTGSTHETPATASAVLRKPVDPRELLGTIRALLRRAGTTSRA